jgi:hypothetical protein
MVTASRHGVLAHFPRAMDRFLPFRLFVGLLLFSGIPFWFPALLGENASGLLHIHVVFGILLALLAAWHYRNAESRPSVAQILHVSIPNNKATTDAFVAELIPLCIAALLFSGIGLVFARIAPPIFIKFFLYVHGAGSSLLFVLLSYAGFRFAARKKTPQSVNGKENEWRSRVIPGVFGLPLTHASVPNKVEGFLQIFGWILKQSKLRLFFEDYRRVVQCKDIFSDQNAPDAEFTPGDYLISIYLKYFTVSGWVNRGVFSGKGLTARHIDAMSSLFYGYVPFNRCRDFDDGVAHQGLMAKYGRFILSEMGIVPNAASSDSALSRSLKMVEMELEKTTGIRVPLSLDKKNSDIVLFPTVDYYFLQVDTLRWLIVILDAMQCNWTLGKAFFDGFNYGAFFGDWFVDRIMDNLSAKAAALGAKKIVLGGCQGISMADPDGRIVEVDNLILDAIAQGKLRFRTDRPHERVGFAPFCDEGCPLCQTASSAKILAAMGCAVVEIGVSRNFGSPSDSDIVDAIREKKPDILVGPYHNSRERLKFLVKRNKLEMDVCDLYELLVKNLKSLDE